MTELFCPRCGVRWWQSGNRTGHCSSCHRTFSGMATFDAHQRMDDGRSVCLNPEDLTDKDGKPRFREVIDRAGATVWKSAAVFDPSVFVGVTVDVSDEEDDFDEATDEDLYTEEVSEQ